MGPTFAETGKLFVRGMGFPAAVSLMALVWGNSTCLATGTFRGGLRLPPSFLGRWVKCTTDGFDWIGLIGWDADWHMPRSGFQSLFLAATP